LLTQLTVSTRLQQVADLSQDITHWSPATGYSYLPPSYEAPKAAATASRIGSPTLAPTDADASQGTTTAQAADSTAPTIESSDALLMQSLNLTNRFGDEYMDENPLIGEPGAFVFTNTRNAVDARNKASEQATQSSQASATAKLDTLPSSVAPSVVATPKGSATPAAIDAQSRKASTGSQPKDKKRERRKSKGLTSPTSPGAGLPPAS
jgi:mediator of RNA polymerase II transcription subunit 6